jgi:hypothetical protein
LAGSDFVERRSADVEVQEAGVRLGVQVELRGESRAQGCEVRARDFQRLVRFAAQDRANPRLGVDVHADVDAVGKAVRLRGA